MTSEQKIDVECTVDTLVSDAECNNEPDIKKWVLDVIKEDGGWSKAKIDYAKKILKQY